MRFKNKKGRPALNRPKNDAGTAELRQKRAFGITAEPLDLCLQYNLISNEQHWAGIHLRWLYTIRFGSSSVQSVNLSDTRSISTRENDLTWQENREVEYKEAIENLTKNNSKQIVMDICIFDKKPMFLKFISDFYNNLSEEKVKNMQHYSKDIITFKEGLNSLVRLWCNGVLKKLKK